ERYLEFLRNDLQRLMAEVDMRGLIFHHDGAVPHYALPVMNYLNQQYTDRCIGRGGPMACLPGGNSHDGRTLRKNHREL
ncbi:hypothetical protein HHI36_015080, partial [Cryptolaemus montrouzieri]